jgi:F0F1-type ATP synthase assembly protein I
MGKKYLSIYITNNIGIETMRLRFERKQVMLKKASNYSMLMILSYFSAIAVTLFVGVLIDIITDNTDLMIDVCTLTFLGFGMLGILCMALSFIYTEKAYERN